MKIRTLLATGGFNIRQWASNIPSVVADLPAAARSDGFDLWHVFGQSDTPEATLGLQWKCDADDLGYKHRPIAYQMLNLGTVYKIMASQYDPIGFVAPFTARAKVIVQDLWKSKRTWDDPIEFGDILTRWHTWEQELADLPKLRLPRCYTPPEVDTKTTNREVHIFSDASERVYGSVAYLRTEGHKGSIHTSFILSCSRVAPKGQLSIPRLELSAALVGAQLANLLRKELTLSIQKITLWSDSTTALCWLKSDSCRYKVFVGTRVAEIQSLSNPENWCYVDTANNPADDITRGKTVYELSNEQRWRNGQSFLSLPPHRWPASPLVDEPDDTVELKGATFCGAITVKEPQLPNPEQYRSWNGLIRAFKELHDAAATADISPSTLVKREEVIEIKLLLQVQVDCFPQEVHALMQNKQLPSGSR
ncbi:uncharacterized protein LOC110976500 [Acanthaster planci]|uniref:Uncharacterized protein LOC110976500 n=1 Tax=Acanthaster planci TaxID=133434 RepID=A0A8B7XZ33_ACAPL|nr:uncharacterized protein LOC110976500 [Acanthaster planci]